MKAVITKLFNVITVFAKTHTITAIAIACAVIITAVGVPLVVNTSYDAPTQTIETSSTPTSTQTIFSSERSSSISSSEKKTTNQKENTKPSHNHTYTTKTVKATCTTGGYTLHTCSCGHSYQSNSTGALGHSYGEWVVTKKATTTATGKKECKCSRCGYKLTETLPKRKPSHSNVNNSIQVETKLVGESYITYYTYKNCRVLDLRTWGKAPTITITSNDGLHVVYYNKKGEKIEVTVDPVKDHINRVNIKEDGTYSFMLTGAYS